MTERIDYRAYAAIVDSKKKRKKSKYNNIKTEIDGHMFDSKAEARRYFELKQLKMNGEIEGFALQPSFLLPGKIRYIPDFIVKDGKGLVWVEDVKGVVTQAFRIKQRLWEEFYPWLELRIIK